MNQNTRIIVFSDIYLLIILSHRSTLIFLITLVRFITFFGFIENLLKIQPNYFRKNTTRNYTRF